MPPDRAAADAQLPSDPPLTEHLAFVERFIQALDYFIVFGEEHMNHVVSELVGHYREERPHQSLGIDLLVPAAKKGKSKKPPPDVIPVSQIACRQRLGGLLKHYYRKAA